MPDDVSLADRVVMDGNMENAQWAGHLLVQFSEWTSVEERLKNPTSSYITIYITWQKI